MSGIRWRFSMRPREQPRARKNRVRVSWCTSMTDAAARVGRSTVNRNEHPVVGPARQRELDHAKVLSDSHDAVGRNRADVVLDGAAGPDDEFADAVVVVGRAIG